MAEGPLLPRPLGPVGAAECSDARTAKVHRMEFSEGQIVVHPQHGPATITKIVTRTFRNTPTPYLRLEVHGTSLVIGVPVPNVEEIGLRPVLGPGALEELFDVLRASSPREEDSWSRRFKRNVEMLKLGDLPTTACVVRDLTRRLERCGLSAGERDLLKQARRPLVVEMALSCSVTDEQAESLVTAAIFNSEPIPAHALAEAI